MHALAVIGQYLDYTAMVDPPVAASLDQELQLGFQGGQAGVGMVELLRRFNP